MVKEPEQSQQQANVQAKVQARVQARVQEHEQELVKLQLQMHEKASGTDDVVAVAVELLAHG